jgi:hypothetical protein
MFRDLCAETAADMVEESGDDHIHALLKGMEEADNLMASLVRCAYAGALAGIDMQRARAEIDAISNRTIRTLAQLRCLAMAPEDGVSLADQSRLMLQGSADEIPAQHRAALAAIAAQHCARDGLDVTALIDWGFDALRESGPLAQTRGLMALAEGAPAPRNVTLLSRALEVSEGIGNQYLRDDALAEMLGQAIATGDVGLVMQVVTRAIHSGWTTFMEALRRAMPRLVEALGPDVVEVLDAAMRRAQTVLRTQATIGRPPEDLDGVSAAHLSADAGTLQVPTWATPDPTYLAMYLDQEDLGPGLKCVQDSRLNGPDPGDDPFERLHGQHTGLVVWLGAPDQAVWRLVDIRFLFNSAVDAAAYHQERLAYNSEGATEVRGAPTVGEDCHVFGGARVIRVGDQSTTITAYCYIFRIDNTVVKLFVAQGVEAREALKPTHVHPIAKKIAVRIRSITGGSLSPS